MSRDLPHSEDFEILVSFSVFAPASVELVAEAQGAELSDIEDAFGRLRSSGYLREVEGGVILTAAGNDVLSRKKFRRVRDIGRMLYLWRGSRGAS